jgi:hypothetical protein
MVHMLDHQRQTADRRRWLYTKAASGDCLIHIVERETHVAKPATPARPATAVAGRPADRRQIKAKPAKPVVALLTALVKLSLRCPPRRRR